MIVVADSSPLHYLILIKQVDLLRLLYSEVVIPEQVLSRPASPIVVSEWFYVDEALIEKEFGRWLEA